MSEIKELVKAVSGREVLPKKCDVRLSETEMQWLTQMATNSGCTKSDIMRLALKNLFKQRQG